MYRGVAFIVRDSLATLRDPASITALAPNESDIHLSCKGTVDNPRGMVTVRVAKKFS